MDLPPEQRFHFHDGTNVGTAEELMRKLASISYVEFYRHVNPDKNDFANWTRHALKDEHLAAELERVSSIVETIEILNDHLHPRAMSVPRADAQSAIERQMFGDAYAGVEEVPTITPAKAQEPHGKEIADFTIIEERLAKDGSAESAGVAVRAPSMPERKEPPAPAITPDHARMIVRDFIFGFLLGLLIGALLGRILP